MSEVKTEFSVRGLARSQKDPKTTLIIDDVSRVFTKKHIQNFIQGSDSTYQLTIYDFTSLEVCKSEVTRMRWNDYNKGGAGYHETARQFKYYDELTPDAKVHFHAVADEVIKYYKEKCGIADFRMPKAYQETRQIWDKEKARELCVKNTVKGDSFSPYS